MEDVSNAPFVIIRLGELPSTASFARSIWLDWLGFLPDVKFELVSLLRSLFFQSLGEFQPHEQLWFALGILVSDSAALWVSLVLAFVEEFTVEESGVDFLAEFLECGLSERTVFTLVMLGQHLPGLPGIDILLMFAQFLTLASIAKQLQFFLQIGELGVIDAIKLHFSNILWALLIKLLHIFTNRLEVQFPSAISSELKIIVRILAPSMSLQSLEVG